MPRTISCKCDENLKIVEYLQKLCDSAVQNEKVRQAATYRKAINGISQIEHALTSGTQARKDVSGIGPVLEKKINSFLNTTGLDISDKENQAPVVNKNVPEKVISKPKEPKQKAYMPRPGTGPYIILNCFILLGELSASRSVEELVDAIQQQNEKKTSFRSTSTLIKRNIMFKFGTRYMLTSEGMQLAEKIKSKSASNQSIYSKTFQDSPQETTVQPIKVSKPKKAKEKNDTTSILKKFKRLSIDPFSYQEPTDNSIILLDDDDDNIVPSKITNISNTKKDDILFSNIMLIIDTREMQFESSGKKKAFLKEKLVEIGIECESRSLSVGDMIWVGITPSNEEYVLDYVVERKATDDLCSSIIDGRYIEQKRRLGKSSFTKILYLLEGNTNSNYQKYGNRSASSSFSSQTLQKTLCSVQVSSKFRTHQTKNLNDTTIFLARITGMLRRKYVYQNCNTKFSSSEFVLFSDYMKDNVKTGELFIGDLFAKQLLQITGCSPERVYAITQLYPTILSLLKAYKNLDKKEGELLLANIKCGESQRNLGPVLSKRIYHIYTCP